MLDCCSCLKAGTVNWRQLVRYKRQVCGKSVLHHPEMRAVLVVWVAQTIDSMATVVQKPGPHWMAKVGMTDCNLEMIVVLMKTQ
jgi:hypothetical protein